MPRIYTTSVRIDADAADAFCALQKDFTDQFVYARKPAGGSGGSVGSADGARGSAASVDAAGAGAGAPAVESSSTNSSAGVEPPYRHFGLGRCIAVADLAEIDTPEDERAPVFFTFRRFDDGDPREADSLFASFPRLAFMLPEIVISEDETGTWLQVNSLGPVYPGRIERFAKRARAAAPRTFRTPSVDVVRDSREEWDGKVSAALAAIEDGRVDKVVLSRRLEVTAAEPFSFKDVLLGLLDGPAEGTVVGYRYGDVFFAGCTPELLVRERGGAVESMCLAGSCAPGGDLLASGKDRREHEYVVDFIRSVIGRNCYDVRIPGEPGILRLPTIWHLHTPVAARLLEGRSSWSLAAQLYPTPALSGLPVGEALMALREIEGFNRGFFGGVAGVVRVGPAGAGACVSKGGSGVRDGAGAGLAGSAESPGLRDGAGAGLATGGSGGAGAGSGCAGAGSGGANCGDSEYSVTIRSGVFDGERGYIYAGCGIVAGSVAESEYRETDLKFATILSAFDATWNDEPAGDEAAAVPTSDKEA